MQPIKFIKQKNNYIDYDVITLVNIVSVGKEQIYYFICDYQVTHNGVTTNECDLLGFDEQAYFTIQENYKISKN